MLCCVGHTQVAKIVPGSTTINYMLTESPAASSVPIPAPTIDMTYNTDSETMKVHTLAHMPHCLLVQPQHKCHTE